MGITWSEHGLVEIHERDIQQRDEVFGRELPLHQGPQRNSRARESERYEHNCIHCERGNGAEDVARPEVLSFREAAEPSVKPRVHVLADYERDPTCHSDPGDDPQQSVPCLLIFPKWGWWHTPANVEENHHGDLSDQRQDLRVERSDRKSSRQCALFLGQAQGQCHPGFG